jgi:hypothetical protein
VVGGGGGGGGVSTEVTGKQGQKEKVPIVYEQISNKS